MSGLTLQEQTFIRLSDMIVSAANEANNSHIDVANERLAAYAREAKDLLTPAERNNLEGRANEIRLFIQQQMLLQPGLERPQGQAAQASAFTRTVEFIKDKFNSFVDTVGKTDLIAAVVIGAISFYSKNLGWGSLVIWLSYKVISYLMTPQQLPIVPIAPARPLAPVNPTPAPRQMQAAQQNINPPVSSSALSSISTSALITRNAAGINAASISSASASGASTSAASVRAADSSSASAPDSLEIVELVNARQSEKARIDANKAPPACTVHAFYALRMISHRFEFMSALFKGRQAAGLSNLQNFMIDHGLADYEIMLQRIRAKRADGQDSPNIGISEFVEEVLIERPSAPAQYAEYSTKLKAGRPSNITGVSPQLLAPIFEHLFIRKEGSKNTEYKGVVFTDINNESFSVISRVSSDDITTIFFDSHENRMVCARSQDAARNYLIEKLGRNVTEGSPTSIDYVLVDSI